MVNILFVAPTSISYWIWKCTLPLEFDGKNNIESENEKEEGYLIYIQDDQEFKLVLNASSYKSF